MHEQLIVANAFTPGAQAINKSAQKKARPAPVGGLSHLDF